MQRFGGVPMQPAAPVSTAMPVNPGFTMQRPQFTAPQSTAMPVRGGMQNFMQHPGVQNFLRQRFGLA